MHIMIARFWYEANSFAPGVADLSAFQSREWLRGEEVPDAFRGTATEIGGALAWAEERPDVSLAFSRCASAPPGGPVEQSLIDRILQEIAEDPVFEAADGIYLSLHGASLGTETLAPEEEIATRLRARFPACPIVASFDMHACPTGALLTALNGATVYRSYPHVDMAETARAALDLLADCVTRGTRPNVLMRAIGKVLPSFRMRTDPGAPMTRIEEAAAALVDPGQGVLAVCPFASFAYADTPAANAGVLVTHDRGSDDAARAVADSVCDLMKELQADFRPDLPTAAEVLSDRPWADGARIAVLEPSDNPLSGGAGDTPALFRAAMEADLPEGSVFAFFNDPELIARCAAAGIGARLDVALGGRLDDRFGAPVKVSIEVMRLTDGRFRNAGPMEAGRPTELGPTALLCAGPLRVIVTATAQSPNDVNYFTLQGIDLDKVPVLLAKAKNHFMAALGPAFDAVVQVDTPGPAMADASALPFRHVPPDRFQLSENFNPNQQEIT
ncbi:Microcystin degradation protein MlrC, contains DUF1485 domain [Salinihabitans flavidus]|uniref:Microcystinase C n=1 Tax=Salinihabitans flavidus TaxID=569882 RepID=A0A1H8NUX8_9RHOB|nr:M81 family metallopeptidase [Salinihabitans flavidus]SEO33203.1 Microcystin degradation protein MlrC, contains DUF1485 domain [Salinihabitans flavidus]